MTSHAGTPKPFLPHSPLDLPDHPDLGSHGCREHPRKKWEGRWGVRMAPEPTVTPRSPARFQRTIPPTHSFWGAVATAGKILKKEFLWPDLGSSSNHFMPSWGRGVQIRAPYPHGREGRRRKESDTPAIGLDKNTEPQRLNFHVQVTTHRKWGPGLHLLFLQGDQRAQHHQALHGHLFCLLHQRDQGLLGGQQGPENRHRRETG